MGMYIKRLGLRAFSSLRCISKITSPFLFTFGRFRAFPLSSHFFPVFPDTPVTDFTLFRPLATFEYPSRYLLIQTSVAT
jgi:hypothetical protein